MVSAITAIARAMVSANFVYFHLRTRVCPLAVCMTILITEMSLFVQAFATSMIPIPSATHPVDKSHALKRKNHRQIQIWTMSTKTVTELGGLDAT